MIAFLIFHFAPWFFFEWWSLSTCREILSETSLLSEKRHESSISVLKDLVDPSLFIHLDLFRTVEWLWPKNTFFAMPRGRLPSLIFQWLPVSENGVFTERLNLPACITLVLTNLLNSLYLHEIIHHVKSSLNSPLRSQLFYPGQKSSVLLQFVTESSLNCPIFSQKRAFPYLFQWPMNHWCQFKNFIPLSLYRICSIQSGRIPFPCGFASPPGVWPLG